MRKKTWKNILGAFAILMLAGTAPFSAFADTEEKETVIRIVHTNDLHGYYKETEGGQIGFSALKALIDQEEADLVLDAGDTFHGQSFATVEEGLGMAELMKEVGYDAVTPGNHDWSYGADRLLELEEAGDFAILASNVTDGEGNDYFSTPYLVKEVEADDGTMVTVGVLGVIDETFYSSTVPDNVAGLEFQNSAAEASETAELLREQEDCDIVLAITHQRDCGSFVAELRGVDAVIAGHEHLLIDETYSDSEGRAVPVVEAGYYFQNAGVLELTYDAETGAVTAAEETFYTAEQTRGMKSDAVDAQAAAIEAREAEILNQVIGASSAAYEYSWEEIRVSEQAIGRIVTAAYLDWTGADVAIENSGGIRAGIPEGDITYESLISISPYGNTLEVKELTGQQILDAVETSLSINAACDAVYAKQKEAVEKGEDPYQYSWPENSGSALQLGGIQVVYDMSRPDGSRVVSALVGGEELQKDQIYEVAGNNYVLSSDDYPEIAAAETASEYGTCEQALIRYIQKGTFEEAAETANLVPAEAAGEPEETLAEPETEASEITGAENSEAEKTETSEQAETEAAEPESGASGNGGSAAVVIVVLLAAVGAFFWKRGKEKKSEGGSN